MNEGFRTVALMTIVSSCAAGAAAPTPVAVLPSYLQDPKASPNPECPPASSFLAVGSSTVGRSEAEERARAAVVRNISSALDVETTRLIETSRRAGRFKQDRRLKELSHERSRFEYAHLIRAVGAPGEWQGATYVLACLDRLEASQAVMTDLEPKLLHFGGAGDRAEAAATRGDRATFSLAYREALADEPAIVALLAEYRTLAGADAAGASDFATRLQQVDETASRIRGGVLLQLAMDGGTLPDALASEVVESVRSALAGYGLRVELAATCSQLPGPALFIQLRTNPVCRWGSLGYACEPHISARALDCLSQQTVFEGPLAGRGLTGIDTRDEARALRRSVERASAAAVAPDLRRMLAAQLPLPAGD